MIYRSFIELVLYRVGGCIGGVVGRNNEKVKVWNII
jgi:hypothetical protein